MRNLLIFAVIAAVLAAGVLFFRRSDSRGPATDGTMALRNAVLSRELFKDVAPESPGNIRAVVYDWHVGNGVASLVAFADGTTSIYLSSGGGVVGAGAHESVQRAAAAFRDEAARVHGHFVSATAFPLPDPGRSRFYVITHNATLQSGAFTDVELRADGHPLHALARQAQQVIAAVRQAS